MLQIRYAPATRRLPELRSCGLLLPVVLAVNKMTSSLQQSFTAYKAGTLSLDDLLLASRAFAVGIARLEGREDAEDLAQAVCMAIWKRVDSFDGLTASYPTWIRRIIRHNIRDRVSHVRSIQAEFRIVGLPEQESEYDDSADVQFHTLDELKTPLTANQQTLVRALADGADIRDIAVSLGITLKAVRNRFDRIKNKTGDFSRNRRLCK